MPTPRTGDEIREAFLRFFEERGHLRHPAASLIPAADPTLLLTNAGMTQFKAYFSGEAAPPRPRMTTAQKCFRATDIDDVGDATHLTLFEMLGNFSFGDYFKREACEWALDLMTRVLGFPEERVYVTVHDEDDEAERIWRDLGTPPERIYRFGDEDNWWGPAGDEGPCGPCSELHIYSGRLEDVPPPGDARRASWGPNLTDDFVELYNLVFTQYYHHLDGSRTELPRKNIDTGMGLERTAAAVQGAASVYETDLFRPLIGKTEALSGHRYGADPATDRAIRVVAEHSRSASFLVGDGVVPGNTGRGYVLRRLIRRGMRFGRQLGLESPFMPELAELVADLMGRVYPELVDNLPFIKRVLALEEEKFSTAVDAGSRLLEQFMNARPQILEFVAAASADASPWQTDSAPAALAAIERVLHPFRHGAVAEVAAMLERICQTAATAPGATVESVREAWDRFLGAGWDASITGYEAAYLYDTYGFPVEVTEEMAAERGMKVDREGFDREMERRRARARAAAHFGGDVAAKRVYEELGVDETPFLGYDPDTATRAGSIVVGIIKNGELVEAAAAGDDVEVVLRETPFYAERGGQIGDAGVIRGADGVVEVGDTQNPYARVNVHRGRVAEGRIEVGDEVVAEVDADRRQRIMRNHTGTHLLHAALRRVLGAHVRQAGSLVAPDRLRFDFTHISPMTPDEILRVQRAVNDKIRENRNVAVEQKTYREAIEGGALAFFGDKYDESRVRTILIDPPWSYELCGGTHCHRTGDIGSFFILSEQSIGAGVRRIEAVTGQGAEELVSSRLKLLDDLSQQLQAPVEEVPARVEALRGQAESSRRKIADLEAALLRASVEGGPATPASDGAVVEVDGERIALKVQRVSAPNVEALRKTGDYVRDRLGSGIVVLGSEIDGRPVIVAMVTRDLVEKGFHARTIARRAARVMGGGGGGRPDVAQAGGRDASKLDEALAAVPGIIAAQGAASLEPAGGDA